MIKKVRIAVDHGNRNMKTCSQVFTTGLTIQDKKPARGEKFLFYEGNLMEAMFSLQEEERKLIYQHVFEERTFKEMSILNQMPEERCKGAYYWAIRKIRKRMGGKRS